MLYILFYFFFQAEDGIRDLVRSRGLGDVYKRQGQILNVLFDIYVEPGAAAPVFFLGQNDEYNRLGPVSYTHLTLPTSDLV